jgi:isoleucyl-tRNA synthetase
VTVETETDILIILKDLVEDVMRRAGIAQYRVIDEISPDTLRTLRFKHPFIDRQSIIVFADYVSADTGTGAVHTAPGHGEEDYETGLAYGLDIYSPVNEKGAFIPEVEFFKGMTVFDANPKVVEKLQELGLLLHTEEIEHSYPHCWRCKKPVIFRATEQWFVSMDSQGLRQKGLDEVEKTQWIPSWGRDRIYNMLSMRPDWCISRQRSWGIPITIFYCESCREPFWCEESFARIVEAVKGSGADIWFEKDAAFFIPEGTKCSHCGNNTFSKEQDILDVWFDSGVSWAAVCKNVPSSNTRRTFILKEATSIGAGFTVPCSPRSAMKGTRHTRLSLLTVLSSTARAKDVEVPRKRYRSP